MVHDTLGGLIRDARERKGYTQEELCYGICTPSTLSRIENGLQMPGKKILEAILQRLGIADRVYNIYLSREETEQFELEHQLMRSLRNGDFTQAELLADSIEQKIDRDSGKNYKRKIEKQYIGFARILIRKHKGEHAGQILEKLLELIRMTIPDFDGLHIKNRLLTFHEIAILKDIGCAYHDMGKLWNGLQLLSELKEYMEKHIVDGDKRSSVQYPLVLQTMSSWLYQEGYHEDALTLCQLGIDFCIEHGKLHTFPMLLCNKACALAELGQYDSSRECFFQSIAIFLAIKQQEHAVRVKKYASRNYGINLDDFFVDNQ